MDPLRASRPAWTGLAAAGEALRLPPRTLLHAGPPFRPRQAPSAPILSSSVLACLHEGWAEDETEAEALIASGQVALRPAQSFGVVTPLAEVVSPRTTLARVVDLSDPAVVAWSPLSSGPGAQMRFGTRNPAVLDRHTWREATLAPILAGALREPIDLLAPARTGLDAGDDLHGVTTGATAALALMLDARMRRDDHAALVRGTLAQSPLFFLTLWMAACRAMLLATADSMPTLLVGLAGNGHDVGVLLGHDLGAWTVTPASAPEGPRLDPSVTASACPVIGDSGVIDVTGFGGQRLPGATAARWLEVRHPVLGVPVGLDAGAVVDHKSPPQVHIGMVGADGRSGLLGRGFYRPPLSLFRDAMTSRIAPTMPT